MNLPRYRANPPERDRCPECDATGVSMERLPGAVAIEQHTCAAGHTWYWQHNFTWQRIAAPPAAP